MKLKEFCSEKEINEAVIRRYKVSERATKLIERLEEKQKVLEKKSKDKKITPEKRREYKENIFAIEKSLPVIKNFRDYFKKLEDAIEGMNESDKIRKIENKYEEIKQLFFDKLYGLMQVLGYNASLIIAAAIASLIFAVVFIPGGGPALLFPTFMVIKKIKENRSKIHNKKFEKEIDHLLERLEKKKRKQLRYY